MNRHHAIDLEFEFSLQQLFRCLSLLRAGDVAAEVQSEFFNWLRQAKLLFENKIVRIYGADYQGGSGARLLLRAARQGRKLCERSGVAEPGLLEVVREYVQEITSLQVATPVKDV